MKVLVTGASGFVGAALVRRLEREPDWQVRASARSPQRVASGVDTAHERVVAPDLSPRADWESIVTGCDVVVHLAARVHVMAKPDAGAIDAYHQVNVEGTMRLAEQAAAASVRRFVFLSSVKVHGESGEVREDSPIAPVDPYGASKWDAEERLTTLSERTGLELVIIRPPLVYGPGVKANFLSLLSAVRRGVPLPLGAIENRRSLVAVDNLVDLIVVCLSHPAAAGQRYLVSDGEDLSTPDLVTRLAAAAGCRPRLIPVPPSWLRAAGALTGKTPAIARLTGTFCVDISKARRDLGWTPPVSVDEALRRVTGVADR